MADLKSKYPVEYNGKLYYEKDCDEVFVNLYSIPESLNDNGGVYVAEGMWVYPDGSMDNY